MVDLDETPQQQDWTKGGWDFPGFQDGPWPEDDPRWQEFYTAQELVTPEQQAHFRSLPAYYLAMRRKFGGNPRQFHTPGGHPHNQQAHDP